jgi:DNA-directed RNA polymerase specialized sigma subunit
MRLFKEANIRKRQKLLRARYKAIQVELRQVSEQLETLKADEYAEKLRRSRERLVLAVQLRDQGMTFKEVGQRLGVGPYRASCLVHKGRRIIANKLQKSYDP